MQSAACPIYISKDEYIVNWKLENKPKRVPETSFMDPDPVSSETFGRIRIPDLGSYGSEMNFK